MCDEDTGEAAASWRSSLKAYPFPVLHNFESHGGAMDSRVCVCVCMRLLLFGMLRSSGKSNTAAGVHSPEV
ncbi:UNVERIFIED_CONTAM: hypothetical protein FKN15_010372 [Acipenser sinensis]